MLLSFNWLKEYVDINITPSELADKLNLAGLPVEEIKTLDSGVSGVIVAKITSIEKHPNADNLSICDVYTGSETLKIVCGAKNIAPGQIVPLATIGAVLPGNITIKKAKIRGFESIGMLCSSKELGIDDGIDGIMQLGDGYKPGQPYVPYSSDTILSLEITPNRPDLLCVTGIARFVSAITGIPCKFPDTSLKKELIDTTLDIHAKLKVDVRDTERCPRYCARLIENVKIMPSPQWLKDRLIASGLRPINNVVDVTNYVLLELNQPLHAFDLSKIKSGNIIVRTALNREKITALDKRIYELKESDLVIADTKEAIAIAGVMGGENFSMDSGSTSVVLESAYFSPKSIRKTSRSLGLSSDSSYRFERGIDIERVSDSLDRAACLIASLSRGMVSRNAIDVYPVKQQRPKVQLRFDRVNSLLGLNLKDDEIKSILSRAGFTRQYGKSPLTVEIPGYRPDVTQEVDLIEDIAQIYGYDNVPLTIPYSPVNVGKNTELNLFISKIHTYMTGRGFLEAKNYSFMNNKLLKDLKEDNYMPVSSVTIKNPFNDDETRLKTSLVPDLLKNLIYNRNSENEDIHLFETAYIYSQDGSKYTQSPFLAGVSCGYIIKPSHNKKEFISDFFFIKSLINGLLDYIKAEKKVIFSLSSSTPFYEYSAEIKSENIIIGRAGQVKEAVLYENKFSKKAFIFELSINALMELSSTSIKYKDISRFPAAKRDLSILIDSGLPESRVEEIIIGEAKGAIRSIYLYDVYKGSQIKEGKKSLTYNLLFQSYERTMSDDEINGFMQSIIKRLQSDLNAELRS